MSWQYHFTRGEGFINYYSMITKACNIYDTRRIALCNVFHLCFGVICFLYHVSDNVEVQELKSITKQDVIDFYQVCSQRIMFLIKML